MKLTEILRKECIAVDQKPESKEDVLKLIASFAKKSAILENISEDYIVEGLKEREALGSTGFGNGIAIPHCRLKGASDFVVGIVTIPNGVDFDALDNKPVKLVVFIIGPETASKNHIRVLSAVSQTLNTPGAINELVNEHSTEAIWESFLRYQRDEVDEANHKNRHLFHVFVQDQEDLFLDILQVFTSLEACSIMVIESQNVGSYLGNSPLFASFWSDGHLGFNRIIVAVIDKKLSNETIRRIEQIAGSLDKRDDVMLTIQDIFYASGLLGA